MTARFPNVRLRRLRDNAGIRRMVQETRLSVDDFIVTFDLKSRQCPELTNCPSTS